VAGPDSSAAPAFTGGKTATVAATVNARAIEAIARFSGGIPRSPVRIVCFDTNLHRIHITGSDHIFCQVYESTPK
jgi:hypothetical protein